MRISTRRFMVLAATALLSSFILPPSSFAVPWSLTTADFKTQQVDLNAISADAVSVTPAGGSQQAVPLANVLKLARTSAATVAPATAPAGFVLHLTAGDHLSGAPVKLEGETLTWQSPAVGALTFPVRQVRWIGRAATPTPRTVTDHPPAEDTLTLANGDVVKGIVAAVAGGKVTVSQQGGDNLPVPVESLQSLVFASTGKAAPGSTPPARAFRLRFGDGSSLVAPSVSLEGQSVSIKLADDPAARTLPLSAIAGIEQLNGPVTFLSSLAPAEDVQRPYLGDPWPTRFDRTVTNQPLRFNGQDFGGIGVHAYSKLVFDLDPSYKSFRTQYAIEGAAPYANVVVRIKLDDKVVHEQKDFTAGVLAGPVKVPINGAKRLTLEVDYGQSNDTQDRFMWLDPALLRADATTEPAK